MNIIKKMLRKSLLMRITSYKFDHSIIHQSCIEIENATPSTIYITAIDSE